MHSAKWIAAGSILMAWAGKASAVTLVEQGQPRAVIVAPAEQPGNLAAAVSDLQGVIARMSGARLAIVDQRPGAGAALVLRADAAGLSPVGYRLRTDGNALIIEGSTQAGLVNGIYGLLEDHLGAHWYVPGLLGEVIPRRATIVLNDLNEQREPAIPSLTGLGGYPADPPRGAEWARRNRLAAFPAYFHSHNWEYLVPSSEREAHPDWFALVDGERKDQLCTTHPEVIRIAARRALQYFAEHPDARTLSLSPNDSGNFCQCDRCRALDRELGVDPFQPGGQFTDRLVYFFNQIAAAVARKYPDKILCFYAYLSHTDPPRAVKPLPNLMPVLCYTPWEFCHAHPLSADCAPARRFRNAVLGWRKLCPHVGIYDYYGHWEWFGQWPLVHDLREDIPFYAKAGIEHLNSETHANWWTQPLNFYVARRLAWDVNADVDALVARFCADLFGTAAEPVRQYFALYEHAMAGIPLDAYRSHEDWMSWPSPQLMEQGRALLERAASLAETSEQKQRVRKLQAGHEIFTLQWRAACARKANDMLGMRDAQLAVLEKAESMARTEDRDVIDQDMVRLTLKDKGDEAQAYVEIMQKAGYLTPQQRAEAAAGDQVALARKLGFITEWKVVGPFPYRPGDLGDPQIAVDRFDPAAPPVIPSPSPVILSEAKNPEASNGGAQGKLREESRQETTGGPASNRPAAWQAVAASNAFGIVDLRELISKDPWVSAYAACWVRLPAPRAITLRLGSNDGAAVWLDGKPILVSDVPRGFTPDIDRISVAAAAEGWHLLLLRIANYGGQWKFALRFTDEGGRPIEVPSRTTPPT